MQVENIIEDHPKQTSMNQQGENIQVMLAIFINWQFKFFPVTISAFYTLQILDAKIKKWSNGKEENLRALLSTLQYVSKTLGICCLLSMIFKISCITISLFL